MPMVELSQGRIHYEEAGAPDGRPVVFVHGVLVDGGVWGAVPERVAAQGLRCLVPTWPMGAHREAMRPGTDLSPKGVAAIVADFLAALDLDDVVLVGNDSGGAISQVVAAEHPERLGALVLTNCDTLEHFPPSVTKVLPPLARVRGGLRALLTPLRAAPLRRSPLGFGLLTHRDIDDLGRRWVAAALRDPGVHGDLRRFVAGLHKRYTLEAANRLRDFGKPIVLAWGSDDVVFPVGHAERFAAVVGSGVRIERVPEARTFPMLDQPDRVAEVVAAAALRATDAAASPVSAG